VTKTARRHRKSKKRLIEDFPCALCWKGSMNGRPFAERLRGWLGKWATNTDCLYPDVLANVHFLLRTSSAGGLMRSKVF